MKELATISALLCVAVIAVIAAPRSAVPTSQNGLGSGDQGTPAQRASVAAPSRPADFPYELSGNNWSAPQGRSVAH